MSKMDRDRPFTADELKRVSRVRPNVRAVRRKLGLSQEEFARTFGFNLATLRDWEQGRSVPEQAVRSYLKVIATNPDVVRLALGPA